MATQQTPGESLYAWEGEDAAGKTVRGEILGSGEAYVSATLRRQGINIRKIIRKRRGIRGKVSEKDTTVFTRQLATMLRAGIPLLQVFDILSQGQEKVLFAHILRSIRSDIESGTNLHNAFSKHPKLFNPLYCSLVAAGEQAGILDQMLERLADYREKTLSIKGKVRAAMTYPLTIVAVSILVMVIIMVMVIPSFKQTFAGFGATLPGPTLFVIGISDFFVNYLWLLIVVTGISAFLLARQFRRSAAFRMRVDQTLLKLPVLGTILLKAVVARWSRTLSTMFASGITLMDALDAVSSAAGNRVFEAASIQIRQAVKNGTSLTGAMQATGAFPHMVTQMVSIGEESGSLDQMLDKVADFYESEVDDAVASLSSLMEPLIMVFLGGIIGALVIALYLPIIKMGALF